MLVPFVSALYTFLRYISLRDTRVSRDINKKIKILVIRMWVCLGLKA
jgi:hypothetical protein